ncbi:MAG: hypothetical protein CVU05_01330 [Bacteroidetes bacterium HGW-Bacteroidetes-21]|nr:MAG: hypothetical protein CVU05_01330 [Bacteroidetes bacterium HGW-Bacteroidetes-21]
MYLEFLLLLSDYFKTLTKRLFIYELIIPAIIGVLIYCLLKNGAVVSSCANFRNNSLTLLGVLVGFSITIITILTTGNSRNLEEIKNIKTKVKIGSQEASLFRLLLINFTYSVVIEIFLIIVNLIYPLIADNYRMRIEIKYIGFSLIVFLIVHVLLLTIRNLTDFYMIITKK